VQFFLAKSLIALALALRVSRNNILPDRQSDAVGEILISNSTVTDRRPNFKFYI
jgi:hypothetical protein